MATSAAFLVLAIAFAYTAVGGARDWRRFTTTDSADTRRYYYKKWVIDTWVALGLGAVAATWALGKLDLLLKPLPHAALQTDLAAVAPQDSGAAAGLAVGIGVGLVAAAALLALRLRRAVKKAEQTVGPTNPLIPVNRQERFLAAHLSVAAGVAEELFFRAAVPVLAFTVTDNYYLSVAAGIVSFGLYHYYQGIKGVLATAFIGFILFRVFTSSGTILAPIGLHIFIDLWGLMIFPAIMKARRPAGVEGGSGSDRDEPALEANRTMP